MFAQVLPEVVLDNRPSYDNLKWMEWIMALKQTFNTQKIDVPGNSMCLSHLNKMFAYAVFGCLLVTSATSFCKYE